jgi:predicted aspartyl protease
MMQGRVNQRCEATLAIAVKNNETNQMVDTVIDTGFPGFLTLPSDMISTLGFRWEGRDIATLGDGTFCTFEVYIGLVIWDGQSASRVGTVHRQNLYRERKVVRKVGWPMPTNQTYTEQSFHSLTVPEKSNSIALLYPNSSSPKSTSTRSPLLSPVLNLQFWNLNEVSVIAS